MISPKLDADCHSVIASHLSDESLRAMTQVDKGANSFFSQDKYYSVPANELRKAWTQVYRTPEGNLAAPQRLEAYHRLQKFHSFVRKQPSPFAKLTATRQQDPNTYAILESRFAFVDAPSPIQAIVANYSQAIPVLELGSNMGHTSHIDFLKPDDLSHPVMRGVDCARRPFLSVKATQEFSDGSVETSVCTIFQRYTDNLHLWVSAQRDRTLFYHNPPAKLHEAPEWCEFLSGLLASGEVHVSAVPHGEYWERRTARHVVLSNHPEV